MGCFPKLVVKKIPSLHFRFMLSLGSCSACLFLDDELNILPLSSTAKEIKPLPPIDPLDTAEQQELRDLKVIRDGGDACFLTTTATHHHSRQ